MKRLKFIVVLIVVLSLFFSVLIFPSRASFFDDAVSLFDWYVDFSQRSSDTLIDGGLFSPVFLKVAYDFIMEGKEQLFPDCDHDWHTRGGPFGHGTKVVFTCSICGEQMELDEDIYRACYDSFVDDLPATGYNSNGHLIWNPTIDDLTSLSKNEYFFHVSVNFSNIAGASAFDGSYFGRAYSVYLSFEPVYDSSRRAVHISVSPSPTYGSGFSFKITRIQFFLEAPISGVYLVRPGVASSAGVLFDDGSSFSSSFSYEDVSLSANTGHSAGSFFTESIRHDFLLGDGKITFGDIYLYLPSYELIPASILEQYNINTRMSSVYGDVAYYDVDGDLQVSKNTTIINEGDKTYYNPVTGDTYYINNWNYDYSDRSYHVTTDTGDDATITYGDKYITIYEGDTVYNIYYYTDGAQLPETHTHEWYHTGQQRPTCTDYGTQKYTCYTCGEQKTEVLPALGHAWLQHGYVAAEYDEDGELIDKAHVLYVCSRCSEEYKDYDGVGPPDAPSGGGESSVDSSGILAWLKDFKDWLGDKLDALTGSGGGDVNIDNDYNFTYTDENGEEHNSNVLDIIGAFNWWMDVADIGRTLVEQVSASEVAAYAYAADPYGGNPPGAPSIPINLGLAQSYYGVDYGGEVEMLDLSWYTPYKKTVDDLLSGFMWLFFVWALIQRAPSIISGAGLSSFWFFQPEESTSLTVSNKGKEK